jgi:hypothetical protein
MNNTILKDDDAAIVFNEEGLKLILPNKEGQEVVPDYVKTCAGIGMLLCNPETQPLIMELIYKLYDDGLKKIEEEIEENEGEGC